MRRLCDPVGVRANQLARGYRVDMTDELAERLARNIKELRDARGLTQAQISKLAVLPRATWANLESSAANPTLAVLHRLAIALQVPLEELIAAPHAEGKLYPKG